MYEGNGVADGRERSICTKETERRMGGNGAFVRRKKSGEWAEAELLYEGNGAFVWCGLRKVYRLSENTL